MTCDKCNKEHKDHELKTINNHTEARVRYGLDDSRLGHYFICAKCAKIQKEGGVK